MTLSEPSTFVTDLLVSLFATVLGVGLLRFGDRRWGSAFLAIAAGALAGGIYHGFASVLASSWGSALWYLTGLFIAAASMLYLWGAEPRWRWLAMAKFVAFMSWFTWNRDFRWILLDYGITFILVTLILRTRRVGAALLVSMVGAAVQQGRVSLHEHFNHNDLYHLIQMVALWLLYRDAVTRATGRSTSPPR